MILVRKWAFSALKKGRAYSLFGGFAVATLLGMAGFAIPTGSGNGNMPVPQYDSDGALVRPRQFYSWVFVGASIGLNYSKSGGQTGPGEFHNVYTQPEAYQEYLRTGKFPEKTMFVMPLYKPAQKVSINRQGYFEGDFIDLDVSVKDRDRFPEGWAYFNFSGEQGKLVEKAKAFPKTMCYSCHREHGANDNVFTQFYPVLRDAKVKR